MTGPAPGIYDQRGTQGDRGDFFSVGRLYNLYWVFYAGEPVNRGRRYLKVLSEAEGVSPQKWSEDIGESEEGATMAWDRSVMVLRSHG